MATDLKIPAQGSRFVQGESIQQTEPGILEFSFASTKPIRQSFGFTEILDLSGIDTSRVDSGVCPLLLNHDTGLILGRVLAVWRIGNTLRCRCELGSTPTALQYGPDIVGGLLRGVSCRYTLDSYLQSVGPDGEQVVTVTAWELLEVTIAAVPADGSVGIGRSLFTEGSNMPTSERSSRERERSRIRVVNAMVEKYAPRISGGMARAIEIGESAIDGEMTEEQARSMFADEILGSQQPIESARRPLPQTDGRAPGMAGRSGQVLGMGQREIQDYSIMRLIQAQIDGDASRAPLEMECHRSLEKQGFRGHNGGFLIPTEALRAPALTYNQPYAGSLVGTDHLGADFISALRSQTIVLELGAHQMNGLMGNVEIPRQSGVSSLGWVQENTDLPESGPTFDKIVMQPKTVGAWTSISRLMATQADPNVENLILQDFRNVLAREIDRASIHGSGVNEPVGILNTAGIGSVSLGVNGGVPTWQSILALQNAVENANAGSAQTGWATSVKLKNSLRGVLKNNVAGAEYIWGDGVAGMPPGMGMLAGDRAMASTTVRSDLSKGTGTNLSVLIYGDWSSLLIGFWGVLSLEINPWQDFRKGTVGLRVMQFCDISVRHPQSFAAVTDAITS